MDFPIEFFFADENRKNKNNSNNLYYRYYVCNQKLDKIECIKCDNHEKVKEISKSNNLYLTERSTNGVFSVYNFPSISFKICKFVPSFFDNAILKFKLFNLMHVRIIKK